MPRRSTVEAGVSPPLTTWGGEGGGVRARRDAVLLVAGTGIAIALSFHMRLRAWPETLVPAYLVSHGWTLYRDVKFAHTPLWIGFEALVALLFRITPASLRALALLPAIAAYLGVWVAGRRLGWSMTSRVVASLFFVATFYLWDANAVYPDVAIAALSIPAYFALRWLDERGAIAAGLLLGCAAAIKQPAAVAAAVAAVWLAARAPRLLPRFILAAAAPLGICGVVMLLAGAGRDSFLWTVIVPLRDYRGRTNLPMNGAQAQFVWLGLLPLALLLILVLRRRSAGNKSDALLLAALAAGFATMALPKFELVHLVPAVPLLALAAGGCFEETRRLGGAWKFARALPLVVIALDFCFLATDTSAGEISYWESPADDAIVARLAALPPAPLYLYGPDQNIFIRSERLPPGRIYSNPDLWYHFRADDLERRQIDALRRHPEAIILATRSGAATGDAGRNLASWLSAHRGRTAWGGGVTRLQPE